MHYHLVHVAVLDHLRAIFQSASSSVAGQQVDLNAARVKVRVIVVGGDAAIAAVAAAYRQLCHEASLDLHTSSLALFHLSPDVEESATVPASDPFGNSTVSSVTATTASCQSPTVSGSAEVPLSPPGSAPGSASKKTPRFRMKSRSRRLDGSLPLVLSDLAEEGATEAQAILTASALAVPGASPVATGTAGTLRRRTASGTALRTKSTNDLMGMSIRAKVQSQSSAATLAIVDLARTPAAMRNNPFFQDPLDVPVSRAAARGKHVPEEANVTVQRSAGGAGWRATFDNAHSEEDEEEEEEPGAEEGDGEESTVKAPVGDTTAAVSSTARRHPHVTARRSARALQRTASEPASLAGSRASSPTADTASPTSGRRTATAAHHRRSSSSGGTVDWEAPVRNGSETNSRQRSSHSLQGDDAAGNERVLQTQTLAAAAIAPADTEGGGGGQGHSRRGSNQDWAFTGAGAGAATDGVGVGVRVGVGISGQVHHRRQGSNTDWAFSGASRPAAEARRRQRASVDATLALCPLVPSDLGVQMDPAAVDSARLFQWLCQGDAWLRREVGRGVAYALAASALPTLCFSGLAGPPASTPPLRSEVRDRERTRDGPTAPTVLPPTGRADRRSPYKKGSGEPVVSMHLARLEEAFSAAARRPPADSAPAHILRSTMRLLAEDAQTQRPLLLYNVSLTLAQAGAGGSSSSSSVNTNGSSNASGSTGTGPSAASTVEVHMTLWQRVCVVPLPAPRAAAGVRIDALQRDALGTTRAFNNRTAQTYTTLLVERLPPPHTGESSAGCSTDDHSAASGVSAASGAIPSTRRSRGGSQLNGAWRASEPEVLLTLGRSQPAETPSSMVVHSLVLTAADAARPLTLLVDGATVTGVLQARIAPCRVVQHADECDAIVAALPLVLPLHAFL